MDKDFEMLQADIYQIQADSQSNKRAILELKQRIKTNNDRIRDLKLALRPLCNHEFGCSWLQRVSPSKEVLMRSCNICDFKIYESELPSDAVIKIIPFSI